MKRQFDLAIACFGLIVFAPLFILLPLFIWLDDGGPVFFKQWRLGKYKRPFVIYKYRTMCNNKVTRVGRWLRKSGLDELPQFFNILRGEMSVVGPRPLTITDVQRLRWDDRYHIRRWHHLPGITGLAQLYAGRGAKVSWFFDRHYNDRQSFRLDMQIIILSFVINIAGKHRVRRWLQRERLSHVNWNTWVKLFAMRRDRPIPATASHELLPALPPSVAKSLAIFQLGESGGGTIVQQVRRSRISGIDRQFARAIALFVDEEHRHADILAQAVLSAGGELIKTNWTAKLFVAGRRLLGLRLKIMVLLAAEVVGICYYKLLATRLPGCQLRSQLEELASDEEAHLQFHSAFLRSQANSGIKRRLFSMAWRTVTYAAALVVTLDHYRALRDLDIPLTLVWQRWMYLVHETEQQILARQPDYEFLQQVNLHYS